MKTFSLNRLTLPNLTKDFVTKISNLQTLIFLAVFRTLASQIGPILRRSCLLFERPDFFLLGLPSVGLGKGYSILVGEARRKRVTFIPLCHSKTWSNTKQLGTTKLSISCRFSIDYDSKNLTKVWWKRLWEVLPSFFPSLFLTITRQSLCNGNFHLQNARSSVSFLRFGISNLTNFKTLLAHFERPDFFSSASLRSASGMGRIFWWGRRAEKGSVFFTLPFKNLVESKTVWYCKTLNFLSFFATQTWPALLLFYCFHIVQLV